jgi:hypothetical protein
VIPPSNENEDDKSEEVNNKEESQPSKKKDKKKKKKKNKGLADFMEDDKEKTAFETENAADNAGEKENKNEENLK